MRAYLLAALFTTWAASLVWVCVCAVREGARLRGRCETCPICRGMGAVQGGRVGGVLRRYTCEHCLGAGHVHSRQD